MNWLTSLISGLKSLFQKILMAVVMMVLRTYQVLEPDGRCLKHVY
jgi:hypothetical protein